MGITFIIHLQAAVTGLAKVAISSLIQLVPYAIQIVHNAKMRVRHVLVVQLGIF